MSSGKKSIIRRRSSGQGSIPTTNLSSNNNDDNIQSPNNAASSGSDAISQTRKRTRRLSARDQAKSGAYELVDGDVDDFANAMLDAYTATIPGNKDKATSSKTAVTDIIVEQTVSTDAPVAEEDAAAMNDDDDESEDEDGSLFGEPMDVDPVPNVALKVERGTTSKMAAPLSSVPSRLAQPVSHRDGTASAASPVKPEAMRKAPKAEKVSVKTTAKKPVTREDNMELACETFANIHGRRHAVPEGVQLYALGKNKKQPLPRVVQKPQIDPSAPSTSSVSTSVAAKAQQMIPQPKKAAVAYGEQTKTTDPRRRAANTTSAAVPAPAPAPAPAASKPADVTHARKTTRVAQPAPAPNVTRSARSATPAPTSAQQVQPARPVMRNVPVVTNLQPIDTGIERPRVARPLAAKAVPDVNAIASGSKVKKTAPVAFVVPSTSSALAKENPGRAAASPSMTSMDRLKVIKAEAAARSTPAPLAPSTGTTPVPSVVSVPASPAPIRTDGPTRLPSPVPERVAAPAPVTPQVPQKRFNPDASSEVPSKRQRVSPKVTSNTLPGPSSSTSAHIGANSFVPPASAAAESEELVVSDRHWNANDELVVIRSGQRLYTAWEKSLVKGSKLFFEKLGETTGATYENRPLVDVTAYCSDELGIELILDELKAEGVILQRPRGYNQRDICRLLCASRSLGFDAIHIRGVEVLHGVWSTAFDFTKRRPMNEALDVIRCVRECDPIRQNVHLCEVFMRAAYDVFSACQNTYNWRTALDALGLDASCIDNVNAVRNHCHGRWAQYRNAPNQEYPSVCPHVPDAQKATEEQRDDKHRRWVEATSQIQNGFVNSCTDWTFDPLRAGWALKSNHLVRPKGWQQCPQGQCRTVVYMAWDRRIGREWDDFQGVVKREVWKEVV